MAELSGGLAGFTLALGKTIVITLAGLVTGISAAFSIFVVYALKMILGVDI